jgi:hypothetical protein
LPRIEVQFATRQAKIADFADRSLEGAEYARILPLAPGHVVHFSKQSNGPLAAMYALDRRTVGGAGDSQIPDGLKSDRLHDVPTMRKVKPTFYSEPQKPFLTDCLTLGQRRWAADVVQEFFNKIG